MSCPGWSRPTVGITNFENLPKEAQHYVAFLEETTGVPPVVDMAVKFRLAPSEIGKLTCSGQSV